MMPRMEEALLRVISFFDKYDLTGAMALLRAVGAQAHVENKFAYRCDAFIFGAL